jgi:hypothetical protein
MNMFIIASAGAKPLDPSVDLARACISAATMLAGFALGVVGVSMIGILFPPNDHTPRGAG